jgi:hypothetical protein
MTCFLANIFVLVPSQDLDFQQSSELGCTIFPPMYLFIAKYLFTGSFKNRSIDILELSLFDLWLFRSFYLRRSSAENLVERDFFN